MQNSQTTIQDVIQIEPNDFRKRSRNALEDNINEKYANKVIQQVGLCLALYDIRSASDGLIGHGTGTVNVNTTFRLLVFRPFAGEIIEGKITRSTTSAIRVGLDFFDDITVPAPAALFAPSALEAEGGVSTWVWKNEGTPYYFDRNERVRFRVEDEVWRDQAPGLKEAMGRATAAVEEEGEARADKSPWSIVGSMQQGGLGVVSWWMDVDDEEAEANGAEQANEGARA